MLLAVSALYLHIPEELLALGFIPGSAACLLCPLVKSPSLLVPEKRLWVPCPIQYSSFSSSFYLCFQHMQFSKPSVSECPLCQEFPWFGFGPCLCHFTLPDSAWC